MALTPGTRLGVYEVTAQIGEGGMGQVYRATDTKLKRQVAIKILPPSLAGDHDRLARFQREAELLASLNHPHIAAIYGLEESAGTTALVMELVEGDDLSQRIARGPIPLDEALRIAKQIADALEAAHERGIIHRDLKPANIKVRSDGAVKVLDFGLAKAMDPTTGASPSVSMSPTITSPAMTQAGVILGTAAYMSPEQAKGLAVDKRSDVWAFGAVLYEMLTGRRAFEGDDIPDTLARILMKEPDWTALSAAAPPTVVAVLRRCLQRDRKQRVRDIGDVSLALEGAFDASSSRSATTAPRPTSATRALAWVSSSAALVFATAWLSVWAPWRAQTHPDRPLARLDVDLGTDVSLPIPGVAGSSVAISPDGMRLAYATGTPSKLFTRRLDQPRAAELPGTLGAVAPFFSADGQWIGFVASGRLNKVSVEGGTVVALADVPNATFLGANWSDDGSILLADYSGLSRIPAGGGRPVAVAGLGPGEALTSPQLLPGGKAILFSAHSTPDVDKFTIEVLTLADHQRKIVSRGGESPRYLATSNGSGHLIYVNRSALFAVPFDLEKLETRATAVPILDDVAYSATSSVGQFALSRTGTLVYRRASSANARLTTVQWIDPAGKKEPLRAVPALYNSLSIAPDGQRVALVVTNGGSQDVWVYDLKRDAMTRLTFGDALYLYPRWSPNGQYVVFSSRGGGIFQARADGASQPRPLTKSKTSQFPWSFTPDGKRLAYDDLGVANWQIWTVPLEDQEGQLKAGMPEQIKSNFYDLNPSFSLDGRWMAYQSNESGVDELYVRAFPPSSSGRGGKWQISNGGGAWSRWSPSGHELLYRSGDEIMATSYTVRDDAFVAGKARVWIAKLGSTNWDLAPDGKRVAVVTPVESADAAKPEHEVVLLENFFDELRRRVPVDK